MIRRGAPLLIAVLLLAGCVWIPSMPELPTPVRPPDIESASDALQFALDGTYPLDALTIRYESGTKPGSGSPALTMTVRGNGTAEMVSNQADQFGTWSSRLTVDEFTALVRLLVDHQVWLIQGQRQSGVPGERYLTVTVEAEGFEPLQAGMWAGEAQQDPNFGPVAGALAGLAQRISGVVQ